MPIKVNFQINFFKRNLPRPRLTHYSTAQNPVSAKAQAALVTKMQDEEMLTDDELAYWAESRHPIMFVSQLHVAGRIWSLVHVRVLIRSVAGIAI